MTQILNYEPFFTTEVGGSWLSDDVRPRAQLSYFGEHPVIRLLPASAPRGARPWERRVESSPIRVPYFSPQTVRMPRAVYEQINNSSAQEALGRFVASQGLEIPQPTERWNGSMQYTFDVPEILALCHGMEVPARQP